MARRLRTGSFQRKLTRIVMGTTVAALAIAGLATGVSETLSFRRAMTQRVRTLAEIVGINSLAALEFEDAEVARETLESLRAQPSLAAAAIYTPDRKLLATWVRPGARAVVPHRPPTSASPDFRGGYLELTRELIFRDQHVGTVWLRSDLSGLTAFAVRLAKTSAVVLLGATGMAFLLAGRLRGAVVRPIERLIAMVKFVSREKDYAVRAVKEEDDELGALVDGFNEMLAQIQARDVERARQEQVLIERAREEERLHQRAEMLARSNRELDEFAYVASHDLKEPLRGIHNYSTFLLEDYADRLDEEGRDKLATLQRLTQRMEALIDRLLHYSRLGRTELAIGPVDLGEVLEEVLATLGPRLQEEGVSVRVAKPLPTAVCDSARVGEIFRNLVSNAIKYNDKEERWIEIGWQDGLEGIPCELPQVTALDDPRVFWVRDNGIGVREKNREMVFRMFKRLHARDAYGGGTGAGLSIVKKIVEQHRGSIWLESVPREGSTFYFTLQGKDPAQVEEKEIDGLEA